MTTLLIVLGVVELILAALIACWLMWGDDAWSRSVCRVVGHRWSDWWPMEVITPDYDYQVGVLCTVRRIYDERVCQRCRAKQLRPSGGAA